MTILAIDQGTTSTRALLMSASGSSKIIKSITHQQFHPKPGWVEHDPEELITNLLHCITSAGRISAIGIDNQGESCLAWDAKTKRAISPVIVWQDNRTQGFIDELKAQNKEAIVLKKAGLPLDAYFSASKLAWILKHNPQAKELLQRGDLRLGTTDAFFLDRLCNQFVTDITTASRTSLLNLKSGQWDEKLCQLFGVPIQTLPTIIPSTGKLGTLTLNNTQTPITASIVDQQAALYGHGCLKKGDAKITFGTGAFAMVNTGNDIYQIPDKGLLPTVAWQLYKQKPVYALEGGVFSAGSALNWAKDTLRLFDDFGQINQFSTPSAISHNLAFVPALNGLACPHWDRQATGLWIGLTLDTKPLDMVQAILEGIAFRAGEVINAMHAIISIKHGISIDGGLSVNPYFCQFLADVLYREITVSTMPEITATGTAKLAGMSHLLTLKTKVSTLNYQPKTNRQTDIEKYSQAIKRASQWQT